MAYNKIVLIGNLGQDPELRATEKGNVLNLSVATSETYKDKDNNWKDSTTWHTVTLWDKAAEAAAKVLKKGDQVLVEGAMKYNTYEDKEGVKRQSAFVQCLAFKRLIKREAKAGEAVEDSQASFSPDDLPM